MKIRNAANNAWITIGTLADANLGLLSLAGGTLTGALLVDDSGTAALPAIAFDGDPDSGIFRGGANEFGIATNGVERVEFGTSEVVFNDGGANYDFRIEGDTNASLFKIDAGLDQVQVANLNGGPLAGTRNRIINGDMRIDQRNAGASVTSAGPIYTVDRWSWYYTSGSGHTIQQNTDAPTGFSNSLKVTIGTGASPSADHQNIIWQPIEGYNVADFGFGAAGASTITFSFWVKSSLAGTFNVWLHNSGDDRSYVSTYTISAANAWEQKTVTVVGDTSGTWLKTNGKGLLVGFSLGCGSNFNATANTWSAADYKSTSGATSVVGTSGATFYITGVQLEPGSTATPFERRSYGQELALCQRYYQKSYQQDTKPGAVTGIGSYWFSLGGSYFGRIAITNNFSVVMRTLPSVVLYDWSGNANRVRTSGGDNQSGFVIQQATDRLITVDYGAGITELLYQYTASSEL